MPSELDRVMAMDSLVRTLTDAAPRLAFYRVCSLVAPSAVRLFTATELFEVYTWGSMGVSNLLTRYPAEREDIPQVTRLVTEPTLKTTMMFKGFLVAPMSARGQPLGFLRIKLGAATAADLAWASLLASTLSYASTVCRSHDEARGRRSSSLSLLQVPLAETRESFLDTR